MVEFCVKNNVLYEDNHCLVINKPAGPATMGLPEGETTLLTLARDYIKQKYHKPGNVYLGVVSRLDFPVSGVIVFARTSKAADRLNEQFRQHAVEKIYHALVEGMPKTDAGTYTDWICEDPRHRKMWITQTPQSVPDARESILHYRLLRKINGNALLEIRLETGRKHQIRLQMSHHGTPILGDRKYQAHTVLPSGIALHARRLVFKHPTTGQSLELVAPFPKFWEKWLPDLQ